MRGKESPQGNAAAISGITPAHAGKRAEQMTPFKTKRDHPRVCGEKFIE